MNKLGIYIHIPFCERRCKYCDFTSSIFNQDRMKEYLDHLLLEIKNNEELLKNYLVDTIFIGGGTPSLLSVEDLRRLVDGLAGVINLDENNEFTIETNPNSISEEKLLAYRELGVNRISIGVQSFNDRLLRIISRLHTADEAREKIKLAKKYFDNLSLDFIFSLPTETISDVIASIDTASELGATHISLYSLILEEGTKLAALVERGVYRVNDQVTDRLIYRKATRHLESLGYKQYEISNFAKDGCYSRHNYKYWSMDEYLGLGMSAHSLIKNKRFFNASSFNEYFDDVKKNIYHDEENLSKEDKIAEYIIFKLRTNEGIIINEINRKYDINFEDIYKEELKKATDEKLLKKCDGRYFYTELGRDLANQVEILFV
ncbi:MAG: radical SAM family heme chaperone HemW [Eubacteriales bacterium]|uniref:radical SAM family heme chaperone HemW n=1 Tax=Fenollaria sp. TaxID=1965292 RepID=UPI002A75A0CA|nr:radical SAM family heme chaperone HemW [Fenollaria sp.]MDD7339897.1 radical SAM family heme chaperone HemW [Eubacteriales bacterium]MDY3105664.1 radical SAM family heme chaperone HemW [Fenollaria sp.]